MLATGVWTAQRGFVPLGAWAMLTLSLRREEEKGRRRPEREEETRKGRGDQKGKRRPERKEARKEDRKRKRKEGNFDNFKCYCSEWPFSYSRLTKLQRNAR